MEPRSGGRLRNDPGLRPFPFALLESQPGNDDWQDPDGHRYNDGMVTIKNTATGPPSLAR